MYIWQMKYDFPYRCSLNASVESSLFKLEWNGTGDHLRELIKEIGTFRFQTLMKCNHCFNDELVAKIFAVMKIEGY